MSIVNNAESKKHERKQRRHYLDVNLTGLSGTLSLYLLGEDLAELNREKSFNTETFKNILGTSPYVNVGIYLSPFSYYTGGYDYASNSAVFCDMSFVFPNDRKHFDYYDYSGHFC